MLDVRAAARRAVAAAAQAPVAVLFGSERTGLTNEELRAGARAAAHSGQSDYPSLNLAMAVQIVAYEICCAAQRQRGSAHAAPRASAPRRWRRPQQMQQLYEHLATVLEEIDFRDRTQSGTHLMSGCGGCSSAPSWTRTRSTSCAAS